MVSFSFVSNYILVSTLISSVILWLFSIILFSHFFLFFPLCFITNLIVLWSEKMIGMISIFLNFWRHILWLPHYLSWEMFHVYLKRKECIFFCYQMKCFLSLSIYMCLCVCVSCWVMSYSLWKYGLQPARLLCLWVLQARVLEWVAMPSSRVSSQPRDWTQVS